MDVILMDYFYNVQNGIRKNHNYNNSNQWFYLIKCQ